jgi:uncharacterized alkaline shock family protein YloU
MPWKRA